MAQAVQRIWEKWAIPDYRLRVQGQLFAHPLGQPHRVANAAYRADGLRALRKAAELRAQVADVGLDDAGLALGIVALNVAQDVRRRERAALVQQEQVQDTALRGRELDAHVVADNLVLRRRKDRVVDTIPGRL